MGEQRIHTSQKVFGYVTGNADRHLTLNEIAEGTGANIGSVSSYLGRMVHRYPGQFVRTGKGIYIWHSKTEGVSSAPVSVPEPEPGIRPGSAVLLSVLSIRKEKFTLADNREVDETRYLVRDEETGDLFVMTPFEF